MSPDTAIRPQPAAHAQVALIALDAFLALFIEKRL
jgi:hypothetical protein